MDTIISSDTPFGIPTNPFKSKKNTFNVHNDKQKKDDIVLFYLSGNKRAVGYMSKSEITKNAQDIDSIKVFIPAAYGASESFPHQILGLPEYAPKLSVCSQTYLYILFDSEKKAKNFINYYKTKFFRALVSARKITQHAYTSAYRFVPIQDFSKTWTDAKLYKKYGLTEDEIRFIEATIKPME